MPSENEHTFESLSDLLDQLQGADLMRAAQFLVKRAMEPVLLGPWEKGETAAGPTPAEREQWVRRSVHGNAIVTVTPVTWLPIERSGRKERMQVSRLSVDLTSIGGPCSPGSASTPTEAFKSADVAARAAGCLLIGDVPPATEVAPDQSPRYVFPPAAIHDAPPPGAFSSTTSPPKAAMRAWGSVGAPKALEAAPPDAAGKLLMLQGGRVDPAPAPAPTAPAPLVIDVESDKDREHSAVVLDTIAKLTTEGPGGAAAPAVTEHSGLARSIVRDTLRRLHKSGRIAPVLRPIRPGEKGIPEFEGMIIEGFRIAVAADDVDLGTPPEG